MPLQFTSVAELREAGFEGFRTVGELRASRLAEVPPQQGVYLVLAEPSWIPSFLAVGTGGHFKGRNPNVAPVTLQYAWVDNTIVLNVGKAGGARYNSTLRKRLSAYLKFGAGQAIGHSGGRYIWQLLGCEQLKFCWLVTAREPRDVEREFIAAFKARFGKRPFANLRD